MRHDPAGAAIVIMLRSLKMYGMAQAVGELMEQGAPAFEAAVPVLSQLLKAETAEREVRSIAYQIKAARFPAYKDLSGLTLRPARSLRPWFASFIDANFLHRRTTSSWWAVQVRVKPMYRQLFASKRLNAIAKKFGSLAPSTWSTPWSRRRCRADQASLLIG